MSAAIFVSLSVIFIGALYYFMFLAKPGAKQGQGNAEGGGGAGEAKANDGEP